MTRDKFDQAVIFAENYVSENSYTKNNPYTILIYGVDGITNVQLQTILNKLNLLTQTETVQQDIQYINQRLG